MAAEKSKEEKSVGPKPATAAPPAPPPVVKLPPLKKKVIEEKPPIFSSNCLFFATIIPLILGYLIVNPIESKVWIGNFERESVSLDEMGVQQIGNYTKQVEFFFMEGAFLHGWLYTPKESKPPLVGDDELRPPVILMALGLGVQKDFANNQIAVDFVNEGFAVFTFDYRHFGGSDGEPRNLISPERQIEDVLTAYHHIQTSKGFFGKVDPGRIILWGTSYGGAHVLTTAGTLGGAEALGREDILEKAKIDVGMPKCVVAQVPYLGVGNSFEKIIKTRGIYGTIRLAWAALSDLARKRLGMPPLSVKIAAPDTINYPPPDAKKIPRAAAIMDNLGLLVVDPKDVNYYLKKAGDYPLGGWFNRSPARSVFEHLSYKPNKYWSGLKDLKTLLITAKDDFMYTRGEAGAAIEEIKGHGAKVTHLEKDTGHWGIYRAQMWQKTKADTVKWMLENCIDVATD